MFIVEAKNSLDWTWALFLLSHYHVRVSIRSDAEKLSSTHLVITEDDLYGQDNTHEKMCAEFRNCEMAFQANFTQKSMRLCDVCKEQVERTGEGSDVCGHLTFESYIVGGK